MKHKTLLSEWDNRKLKQPEDHGSGKKQNNSSVLACVQKIPLPQKKIQRGDICESPS